MSIQIKLLFLYILFIPIFNFSQTSEDSKLDSFCVIWKDSTKPDSVRLPALLNIIWGEYLFVNPDSGVFYANKMYDFANECNNQTYIASSYNLQGIAFQIKGQNDSAVKYFRKVKDIFLELNNKHGVGVALNNIALALKDLGEFDKCLDYFNQAYNLYKNENDPKDMGSALHNIGTIYSDMGNYPMAMQYFHKALNLGDSINDKSRKAFALLEIGIIVLDFENDNEKALEYFFKSLVLREEINEKIQIPGSLISIAEVYKNRREFEKALSFLNRALTICEEIGEKKRISKTYIEMGSVYFELKQYDKSIYFLEKARELNKFVDYKIGIALSLDKLGLVYEKLNQPLKAIKNSKMAFSISDEIGDLKGIELSTNILYRNYKKLNKIAIALKMYELNILIKDSIINQDNLQSIINQQYQYEYEKKVLADSIRYQDEIIIHQSEVKAEQEESKRQRVILYGVIVLLGLIVAFSVYLYSRFRLIRRQRNLINEQKKTVDKAYGELGAEKKKVESKNKQIITSINYAKKIQTAILPEEELMKEYFSEHFVLFKPKDIVGGDFYWYRSFGDIAVIACVDCTGHGVPGGFMSMMGSLLLDKIVQNKKLTSAEILDQLNSEIIRVLKQETGGEIQDGMDLSLCIIDKKKKQLHFSGARNGIYVIDGENIISYKADMLPAGGSFSKKSREMIREFTSQTIALKENSWVIMYSDGFPDQLGGDKMRSIGNNKFEEIIQKVVTLKKDKNEFLMNEFNTWKGLFPQVDDLLVVGFKI